MGWRDLIGSTVLKRPFKKKKTCSSYSSFILTSKSSLMVLSACSLEHLNLGSLRACQFYNWILVCALCLYNCFYFNLWILCLFFVYIFLFGQMLCRCYICLVEYEEGESMRILPCHHEFHRSCIDKWLKEIHRYLYESESDQFALPMSRCLIFERR